MLNELFADVIGAPDAANHVVKQPKLPPIIKNEANEPMFPIGMWDAPVVIAPNNFVHKSLSNWACNIAVGCGHKCRFCYVVDASTRKLAKPLRAYGVEDPDSEWGDYVLLRPWDEAKFLSSLRAAESIPRSELKPDGNRAVIFCSTTDAYQVIRHPDSNRRRELNAHLEYVVRRSLELIRDYSTLNVRILTRSPLARRDFDLYKSFGNRLLFGMSIPTTRNDLAKIYEPGAPAPSQRLATLRAAKQAGIPVFVAVAPTYPECDERDIRNTLSAVAAADPITIYHEPINIRAENVKRIEEHARSIGATINTSVFATPECWQRYAIDSLETMHQLAWESGLADRLHLWPDQGLGSKSVIQSAPDPEAYEAWIRHWWTRISEWPT